jgi:outer membrane protein OmpA-like peptidoglycan-associated protein
MERARATTHAHDAALTNGPALGGVHRTMVAQTHARSLMRAAGNRTAGVLIQRACSCHLNVSQPGDRFEQEADRTADRVMRMPAAAVQRKCAACRDEDARVQRTCKACEEDDRRLMAKGEGASLQVPPVVERAIASGGGQPLPPSARDFFEPRFGVDFGSVRVHTGSLAAEASRQINARAFTFGTGVFFGAGEYRPESSGGRHLLAHELTHVVQQGGGGSVVRRQTTEGRAAGGGRTVPPATGGRVPEGTGRATPPRRGGTTTPAPAMPCARAGPGHVPGLVDIQFTQGSSTLSATAQGALASLASTWSSGARPTLRVDGYASIEGSVSSNLRLSCQRADTTARELIRLGIPSRSVERVAHGETVEFSRRSLEPNRRVIVAERARVVPPRPARPRVCGGIDGFFRTVLLIEPGLANDIVTCVCFGASIADAIPIPAVGTSPYVEAADCLCNIFTALQQVYTRGSDGGCWSIDNLTASDLLALGALSGIAVVDCGSLPVGTALAGFIGGLIGTAAEPGGGTVAGAGGGAVLGDFIVDLAAMALQNLITQGTPLPVAQVQACGRLALRVGERARRRRAPAPRPAVRGRRDRGTGRGTGGGTEPTAPPVTPTPSWVCGPDVTSQVAGAVASIRSRWATWTPTQRDNACTGFTSFAADPGRGGGPAYLNAWDIGQLFDKAWINRAPYFPACATPNPGCQDTVTVDGNCFYAGSVNYVSFGTMWSLCRGQFTITGPLRFSETAMLALIDLYKGRLPGRAPAANWIPSREWARRGYSGWSGSGTPAPDRSRCATTCGTRLPTATRFRVYWYPNGWF